MFYLRVVQNHKHFTIADFNVDQVRKACTSHDASPPSVYKVHSKAAADRIATLYCMSIRERPDNLDYVLIPCEILESLGLDAEPDPGDIKHPLLEQSHHEIKGLDHPENLNRLINVLERRGIEGKRLYRGELAQLASVELCDSQNQGFAQGLVEGKAKWLIGATNVTCPSPKTSSADTPAR